MKQNKNNLRKNNVYSDNLHVGIELELGIPSDDIDTHDDLACYDNVRDYWSSLSKVEILKDHFGLSHSEADQIAPYFDSEQAIDDIMAGWSCEDIRCSYLHRGIDRDEMSRELSQLTGNNSFKVVSDSSIDVYNCVDAEVCWNYYAHKDTIKDNAKILKWLSDQGAEFNTSCGLHINLNNYLNVPQANIPTGELDFLFNCVAPSRRKSSYCNKYAVSHDEKYSMIYHQEDRLEFRFFSPTLDADKLKHYVILANTVYNRLAGKDKKLPKKTAEYLVNKMIATNNIDEEIAHETIRKINSIRSVASYQELSNDLIAA